MSAAGSLATSQLFYHPFDEALQLRRLAPVGVEEQVNGTRGRFVVRQYSDEPPGREVRAYQVFREESQSETFERRLQ